MYVVVQHRIKDPVAAFSRGAKLIRGEGAPPETQALQFYPSRDQSAVTCLWEGESIAAIQDYVDQTLGSASENRCYEIDTELAFADRPLGLPPAAVPA